ncbi:hypothetical protein N9N67_01590 [Bacteriovoracaceae bacterium]|nr:hypothetical protein [Bacteriovoracaceae bacterium]
MLGFKFFFTAEEFEFKKFCHGEVFQNYLLIKDFLVKHLYLNQAVERVFSKCLKKNSRKLSLRVRKEEDLNFNLLSSKNENERILINKKLQQLQKKGLEHLTLFETYEALVLYQKIGNIGKIQKIIYEVLKMGGDFSHFEKASFTTKEEILRDEKVVIELLLKLKKIEQIEPMMNLFSFFLFQFISPENKDSFQDDLNPNMNVFSLQDLFLNNPLYSEQLSYFWLLMMSRNIYKPQASYFKKSKYLIGLLPQRPRFYFFYRNLNNRFLNIFYEGNIVFQKKVRERWAKFEGEKISIYNKLLELDSLDSNNTTQTFRFIKDSNDFLLFLIYFSENTSQLKGFKKYQSENL